MAEIAVKYPNEWVLIDRPKTRRGSHAVLGGYVVMHNPDRDDFDRRLFDFPGVTDGAILFTGNPDSEESYFLPFKYEL